jgi:hypothetical protein
MTNTAESIAAALNNILTPNNPNSGIAQALDSEHIWIYDEQCNWVTDADDVRDWISDHGDDVYDDEDNYGPYDSLIEHCDAVTDTEVALLVLDEHNALCCDTSGNDVLTSDHLTVAQQTALWEAGAKIAEGWIECAREQWGDDTESAREQVLGYEFEADADVMFLREVARSAGIAWDAGAVNPDQAGHLSQRCADDIWENVLEGYASAVHGALPLSDNE